ncbi:MAG: M48 family metallopeptidase [Burkholderiaceae bacterium]|nr:M48 family metallopeptidase [Burkholderiaceae bacterium]
MKKSILTSALLAVLALEPGAAHADLPDLGDIAQATMSQADEARIGRDAMRALRQEGAISDDPELNRYINDIGGRMASGAQIPGLTFTFFIVDDNSINAFAMPGGYVGVNKGVILATQSEGELASVLGHEMAHVTQHHIARMQASNTPNQLLLLGTLVAAALASRAGNSEAVFGTLNAGMGLSVANQLSFSRDFEREADRVGMRYLAAAGYDVREMPTFFQRLQQSERLNGGNAYAFLRTHPVTSERISEAENRAQSMPVRMRVSSTEYLLVREKIRSAMLEPAAGIKFYQSALARKLYLSEGAQWYGLARARLRQGDSAGARQALANARKLLPSDPMLFCLEADIARKAENWPQALSAYRAGLAAFPDYPPLIAREIDLLLQLGERDQALARIRNRQALTPDDPALFRLQAQAYADRDPLRYHAALGNALYFEQMYEAALEQYHLASQAKGDDFYLRSSIEARIRELEARLSDDKRNGDGRGAGAMQ